MSSMREVLRDEFEDSLQARMAAEPLPVVEPLEANEPADEKPRLQLETEVNDTEEDESEVHETEDNETEGDDPSTPYEMFRQELVTVFDWAYENRMTTYVYGLSLGMSFPKVGWGILALAWTVPTLTVIKHSEWFQPLRMEVKDLLAILAVCILSESLAMYCISRIICN